MASEWTEELKKQVIEEYQKANPTPETSVDIVKEIAETHEKTANGVRMILTTAGVYVSKKVEGKDSSSSSKSGSGGKKVSKEASIGALKKAIEDKGLEVDEDILGKLTGKAAVYFTGLLTKVK